jgi:hypothetical protein
MKKKEQYNQSGFEIRLPRRRLIISISRASLLRQEGGN